MPPFPHGIGPRRYLAIFLPLLPADRWLREGGSTGRPTAFVETAKNAIRLAALNEEALALGLTPGMTLADARARVPDLLNLDHDPVGDQRLLEWLADGCGLYSPMVALGPPDGIILDITGCAHLWGGEQGLLADLTARLARQGFTARIALAETPDKARALAQYGGDVIAINRRTPPSAIQETRRAYRAEVAPLPVAALDLAEDQTLALRRAGLMSVGMVAERPRAAFAARFGQGMTTKLSRVLGEEDARITPRRVAPALFFLHRFAEPVARTDYVLEVIQGLAMEAQEALRERGEGARLFTASLFRSDGDTKLLTIETGSATRDPALIMRLMRERIEALADPLDPGFGYDAIRLDVAGNESVALVQPRLDREAETGEALAALVDRIGVRLGRNRVRRLHPGNSHIPELASLSGPASAPPLPLPVSWPWPEAEQNEPPLRPLRLFDPPQRIDVLAEVPDGPPRRFRWRRATHDIIAHEGPERIASEWWRRREGHEGGGLTRDYFRVEDSEGRRYWLFRHGLYGDERVNPDWYLHGSFV
jgi:protein ImuB